MSLLCPSLAPRPAGAEDAGLAPVGVQLQQPGIQPEEMNGVRDETASHFSWTACLFQV